jgi:hypothetical protein
MKSPVAVQFLPQKTWVYFEQDHQSLGNKVREVSVSMALEI